MNEKDLDKLVNLQPYIEAEMDSISDFRSSNTFFAKSTIRNHYKQIRLLEYFYSQMYDIVSDYVSEYRISEEVGKGLNDLFDLFMEMRPETRKLILPQIIKMVPKFKCKKEINCGTTL